MQPTQSLLLPEPGCCGLALAQNILAIRMLGARGVGRCRNILTGMGRCEEELATQNELDVERLHHPRVLFGLLYVCTYTVTH